MERRDNRKGKEGGSDKRGRREYNRKGEQGREEGVIKGEGERKVKMRSEREKGKRDVRGK